MQRSHYQENKIPMRMPSRGIDRVRSRHEVNIDQNRRGGRNDRRIPYSREDRSGYSTRGMHESRHRLNSLPTMTSDWTTENETYGLNIDFLRELNISLPLKNRVYIGNIPKHVSVGHIYEICALAGRVTWIDVYLDQDYRAMGRAACEYSHPIEAVQAISMLCGQLLYNNTLMVKMDVRPKGSHTREGEFPAGLSGIGLGLGLNGAPLNLMSPTTKTTQF